MKNLKVRIVKTTFGKLEYSIYGKGEPILFIHGGHSNSREILTHKHIDKKKFTFITPSRPGYGNTQLTNNHSPIESSRQIMELMDKLNIDKFNVIGISAGGLTAIALVSLNPNRIKKFIMISSISKRWLTPSDDLYKKAKLLFNPKIEKYTWGTVKLFLRVFPKLLIKSMLPELSTVKIIELDDEEVYDMKTMLSNQRSRKGFITDLEHNLNTNIIENIQVPTLIIHSKNDNSVSKDHPVFANKKIKNSKLIWIDNHWGHLVWIGQGSIEVANKITEFLISKTSP